jgi:hypothetical protein
MGFIDMTRKPIKNDTIEKKSTQIHSRLLKNGWNCFIRYLLEGSMQLAQLIFSSLSKWCTAETLSFDHSSPALSAHYQLAMHVSQFQSTICRDSFFERFV